MLVVGDREVETSTVSVRERSGGDKGSSAIDAFIASARDEIARKGQVPVTA
jgi:threonyl-tRNA synthetase